MDFMHANKANYGRIHIQGKSNNNLGDINLARTPEQTAKTVCHDQNVALFQERSVQGVEELLCTQSSMLVNMETSLQGIYGSCIQVSSVPLIAHTSPTKVLLRI